VNLRTLDPELDDVDATFGRLVSAFTAATALG
jgi:hypothetical protein